ncbi:hypothetical protein Pint_33697 [Pistacia integerrima]|uniref:Uncharacterized protein n=1 Tax=Pistacia integerrima TaxID=434235 RepID=A0ACC0X5C2_9ROSI|nr:hypothetical protein Pint_33697 [Pistacia integerrima]
MILVWGNIVGNLALAALGPPCAFNPRLAVKWVANFVPRELWVLKAICHLGKLWSNWSMPLACRIYAMVFSCEPAVSSNIITLNLVDNWFAPCFSVFDQGMGEPLNNYASLVEAVRIMTGLPFQLSPKRITVSTETLDLQACQLHLIFLSRCPLPDNACSTSFSSGKTYGQQKIFIEYIMLDKVNDEEQHAHQLGKLLETFQVVVNLISFNSIGTLSQFNTSSEEKVSSFQKILRGTSNIWTTVRKQIGQDIMGACGQLVVNQTDKRSVENTGRMTDTGFWSLIIQL